MEQAAAAFEAGDIKTAAGIYAAAIKEDAENVEAIAGLAKCYI